MFKDKKTGIRARAYRALTQAWEFVEGGFDAPHLHARIDALETRCEREARDADAWQRELAGVEAAHAETERERDEATRRGDVAWIACGDLRRALAKFGRHTDACASRTGPDRVTFGPCDCGLIETIAGAYEGASIQPADPMAHVSGPTGPTGRVDMAHGATGATGPASADAGVLAADRLCRDFAERNAS